MTYTLVLIVVAIVFFWAGYYCGSILKSPDVDKFDSPTDKGDK